MPKALWTLLLCVCCLSAGRSVAQNRNEIVVHGTVTNASGTPLDGVLVEHKESRLFTLTDREGRFTLRVPDENASLILSLTDYTPVEVFIGKSRSLKIILPEGGGIPTPKQLSCTVNRDGR